MPYDIQKKGKMHQLVNKVTGRLMGAHKTKKEAQSQMAAVHANEAPMRKNLSKETSVHMNGSFPKA